VQILVCAPPTRDQNTGGQWCMYVAVMCKRG